jgi:Arf-GAP/coiled-coil/ANK repeat/PH domain-containing protein
LEGHRAGVQLLEPLEGKLNDLLEEIKQVKLTNESNAATRAEQRTMIEKKLTDDQLAIEAIRESSKTSSGIRDFDSSESSTSSGALVGVLYSPPPHHVRYLCRVQEGEFVATSPTETVRIPLMLATVKEARDQPYRFVLSIISPMKTIHLQCTDVLSLRSWVDTIQNGIRAGLDQGNGARAGEKTQSNKVTSSCERLWALDGNRQCADCGREDPDWVSTNLGITLCLDCSGAHRNLGVHISTVRSATLDHLDPLLLSYGHSGQCAIKRHLASQYSRRKICPRLRNTQV